MSIKFCDTCKQAYATKRTFFRRPYYYCLKCKARTREIGEEEALLKLSKKGKDMSLISENPVDDLTYINKIYKGADIDLEMLQVEDAILHNPDNTDALFVLATLQFNKGNLDASQKTLEKIMSINPNHAEAQLFLANKFPVNAKELEGLDKIDSIDRLYPVAHSYYKQEKWEDAVYLFKRIIARFPRHLKSRRCLAELAIRGERFREAINHLSILKLLKPEDPYIHYNLGIASYADSDSARALSSFREVYKLSDDAALKEEVLAYIQDLESKG